MTHGQMEEAITRALDVDLRAVDEHQLVETMGVLVLGELTLRQTAVRYSVRIEEAVAEFKRRTGGESCPV